MTNVDEERIRLIAREVAEDKVIQHLSLCPFSKGNIESRLRLIEISFARLVGFMLGSGIIGGTIGATLGQIIKHI